jgi:hypothetical protein
VKPGAEKRRESNRSREAEREQPERATGAEKRSREAEREQPEQRTERERVVDDE